MTEEVFRDTTKASTRRAKVDPKVKRPLQIDDTEKAQVVERFSDAFYAINDGLAIWQHDEEYKVSRNEADQWALAFYDTAEQYELLDRLKDGTGPVMLTIITGRILLRDVFHYISTRDKRRIEEEYQWEPIDPNATMKVPA